MLTRQIVPGNQRVNSRKPTIPAHASDRQVNTIHNKAGIAPNDFRAIPNNHTVNPVAKEASMTSKQKVSTVTRLTITVS